MTIEQQGGDIMRIVTGLVFLAIMLGICLGAGWGIWDSQVRTYKVEGTIVKLFHTVWDKQGCYLVQANVTSLGGDVYDAPKLKMLEVKKNMFYNHINEDMLYLGLKENTTYSFTCWGWGMEYWWIVATYYYPNIVEAVEIS